MNCKKVAKNIRTELTKYIKKNKLKSLIIGISGGVDSALVAALAKPVCDKLGIPLIGRSLPTSSNKSNERERANLVGEEFCHDYKEVDIQHYFIHMGGSLFNDEGKHNDETRDKIRNGNIKARIRMIYLYNLAFLNDGLVLSCDNKTEEMLGFFTIHGDHCDYGMIQNLWKTEVYDITQYLAINECNKKGKNALLFCVEAAPTDGNGITSTDLEQLGADTYYDVDNILGIYLVDGNATDKKKIKNHPVIIRHNKTHFKRNWPINIPREILFK